MKIGPERTLIDADPERCLGCRSCELACAVAHGGGVGLFGAVLAGLRLRPRNHVASADGLVLPIQCRQCENAPCATVCPTGATRLVDGRVEVDRQRCVGCKLCMLVCPFGAVDVRAEGPDSDDPPRAVALKCDLCVEWRAANDKAVTACVEACPTRALALIDLAQYRAAVLAARARELVQTHKVLGGRRF